MKSKLIRQYSDLTIAGTISLPFSRELTELEDLTLIEAINNSRASVTAICLGCPKQEIFAFKHLGKIDSVMIGLGAVFAQYANDAPRAPKLVRELSLEWLWRLCLEPARLWPRYSKTIPRFLLLCK